mmetsp:Transcript_19980/g.75441  ORF Transcript_19980/g.75441 Transcript_19980/m.75441 type:complete len:327 (-) Transcript_19980:205-1185(-)
MDAEVGYLDLPLGVEQHVGGAEVEVVQVLVVQMLHAGADLREVRPHRALVERGASACQVQQLVGQATSRAPLGHDVEEVVLLKGVEDADDVGVLDLAQAIDLRHDGVVLQEAVLAQPVAAVVVRPGVRGPSAHEARHPPQLLQGAWEAVLEPHGVEHPSEARRGDLLLDPKLVLHVSLDARNVVWRLVLGVVAVAGHAALANEGREVRGVLLDVVEELVELSFVMQHHAHVGHAHDLVVFDFQVHAAQRLRRRFGLLRLARRQVHLVEAVLFLGAGRAVDAARGALLNRREGQVVHGAEPPHLLLHGRLFRPHSRNGRASAGALGA